MTPRSARAPAGDHGSVLPLVFAFAAIGALLLAVVVATSTVFLTQRRLSAAADGAAAAAADAMAEDAYYSGGGDAALRLDPAATSAALESYVDDARLADRFDDLSAVPRLGEDRTVVTVTLRATVALPLGGLLGRHGRYPLSVTASARSPLGEDAPARRRVASSGSE